MRGRKHKATGGVNEAAEDLKKKTPDRVNAPEIDKEAEERKRGGRAKRKSGGKVHGADAMCHAGRKPRKSGGRASSDANPFTSARKGTPPKGHKMDMEMESE